MIWTILQLTDLQDSCPVQGSNNISLDLKKITAYKYKSPEVVAAERQFPLILGLLESEITGADMGDAELLVEHT